MLAWLRTGKVTWHYCAPMNTMQSFGQAVILFSFFLPSLNQINSARLRFSISIFVIRWEDFLCWCAFLVQRSCIWFQVWWYSWQPSFFSYLLARFCFLHIRLRGGVMVSSLRRSRFLMYRSMQGCGVLSVRQSKNWFLTCTSSVPGNCNKYASRRQVIFPAVALLNERRFAAGTFFLTSNTSG